MSVRGGERGTRDLQLLRGLGDRDVAVLALVDRMPDVSAAAAAEHLDMRRWRVRRAVARLRRRGLVQPSAGGLRVTERGDGLGAAGLIARLLGGLGPRGRPGGLWGARLRGVEPGERSIASIARLLRGVDPGDRLDTLARLARTGTVAEREAAIRVLGGLREPAAGAELEQLVAELDDDGLRATAARALALSGDRQAAPMLRDIVAGGSSVMRAAAADALGVLGDREATEVLATATDFASTPVRQAVAGALGRIGDPGGVDALATLLVDADRRVRAGARTALRTMDTADALAALGANPRRDRLRRARDLRRAQTAQRRRARVRDTAPLRLARLDARNLATPIRFSAMGATVLAVDAIVLGFEPVAVGAAVAVLTAVGYLGARDALYDVKPRQGALTRLDMARHRARPMPAGAVVEPALVTVIRSFSWRLVRGALVVSAVVVAVDAVAGRLGLAAGLLGGMIAATAVFDFLAGRRAATWQRDHGVELLGEAVGADVTERRYYVRPRT